MDYVIIQETVVVPKRKAIEILLLCKTRWEATLGAVAQALDALGLEN